VARKLIYVPIIHSQADLGSLAERLPAMARERLGAETWRRHRRRTEEFWRKLRVKVMARVSQELADTPGCGVAAQPPRGWDNLRVYQDGMPAAGETARRIVQELAEKGSPNYQLVGELMARGAHLERTEQADLLKQEYRMIREIITASEPAERDRARQQYSRISESLLEQRDRFIAERIGETLREGEVGLLFIGALHRVQEYLPEDIEVIPVG
jgi:hypothetical protein